MLSEHLLQFILSGITIGSIYAVTAIGFNIIYNTTGIINFAQGEFLVLGSMTAVTLHNYMPLGFAIAFAIIITALIGALIDFIFIRRLRSNSVLHMIVLTIGISIIIREAVLHIWDEKVRALPFFSGTELSSIRIFNAFISPQVLWVLALVGLLVILLNLFFKYTQSGRSMQGCADNPLAARLCGYKVKNLVTLSFVISAGLGAAAGCFICPITQVQYDNGASLAIKGFTVAVMGGLGNNNGALLAGLLLGILEIISIIFIPFAFKDIIAIILLLMILFIKPSGLFGDSERSKLKDF